MYEILPQNLVPRGRGEPRFTQCTLPAPPSGFRAREPLVPQKTRIGKSGRAMATALAELGCPCMAGRPVL